MVLPRRIARLAVFAIASLAVTSCSRPPEPAVLQALTERYWHGSHGWQADDLHHLASCTKSIDSLLIGMAIDRGEIAGVDVPLLDFFPDHRAQAGAG